MFSRLRRGVEPVYLRQFSKRRLRRSFRVVLDGVPLAVKCSADPCTPWGTPVFFAGFSGHEVFREGVIFLTFGGCGGILRAFGFVQFSGARDCRYQAGQILRMVLDV